MPRALRIEFEGAVYHVMCRGDRQEPIFKDRKDHDIFLKTLGEVSSRCGWRLHAYVLMGNHYHFLLETPEANLVRGMQWFQGVYTQRFNSRHKLWGHLFQGRYKALLVDGADEYFSTVLNYIHLNPARAHCFDLKQGRLADFEWSSYCSYLRPGTRPKWLDVGRGLASCGYMDDSSGRSRYRLSMQKRVLEILHRDDPAQIDEAWKKIRRGWVFGSESFCTKMKGELSTAIEGNRRESYSGGAAVRHDEQAAQKLLEAGLHNLNLSRSQLAEMKKGANCKKVLAWLIRQNTSVKNDWISTALNMGHPSSISRAMGEVERAKDEELVKLRSKISKFKD